MLLFFCVLLTKVTYITSSDSYVKSIEELQQELESLDPNSSSFSVHHMISRLQSEINDLSFEALSLSEYTRIPEVCKRTYRCESAEYRAGCPCWSRELQQERRRDSATSVYTYNEYHPRGATPPSALTQHDAVRQCDEVPPPWGWLYIYSGAGVSGRLAEFAHCVRDGVVDCYCSSTRFLHEFAEFPFEEKSKVDPAVCDANKRYPCYNCEGCPCWNSNVTCYDSDDHPIVTSLPEDDGDTITVRISTVFCPSVHLACDDDALKPACPCWDVELEHENQFSIEFEYIFRLRNGPIVVATPENQAIKEKEDYYGQLCRHKEFITSVENGGFNTNNHFSHCVRDGHVVCYCTKAIAASVLGTIDCASDTVPVSGTCARVGKQ